VDGPNQQVVVSNGEDDKVFLPYTVVLDLNYSGITILIKHQTQQSRTHICYSSGAKASSLWKQTIPKFLHPTTA
jgi:hypothetical protein